MGNQRIGGNGQRFVEQKEREHIGRKRDPHDRKNRKTKAGKEPCVILFIIPAHVSDAIKMCHHPKARGENGKQQSKRFDVKGDLQTGHNAECDKSIAGPAAFVCKDAEYAQKGAKSDTESHRIAQIGLITQQ